MQRARTDGMLGDISGAPLIPAKDKPDKGDADKADKAKKDDKKDKKEDKPHKFPQFASRKLKKDCLESAIASCYRLQAARTMQVHMAMSYASMIVVQLITLLTQ